MLRFFSECTSNSENSPEKEMRVIYILLLELLIKNNLQKNQTIAKKGKLF